MLTREKLAEDLQVSQLILPLAKIACGLLDDSSYDIYREAILTAWDAEELPTVQKVLASQADFLKGLDKSGKLGADQTPGLTLAMCFLMLHWSIVTQELCRRLKIEPEVPDGG